MMKKFKVAETFVSINGEGRKAGQLAVFIRFIGCNLNCTYCDTTWANKVDAPFTYMTKEDIYNYIKQSGVRNVTITGGEPLLQPDIAELLRFLSEDECLSIEIETNGSINLGDVIDISDRVTYTLDYKLPMSGMEKFMDMDNYKLLRPIDTVKFVSGSIEDLDKALYIIRNYMNDKKDGIYLSPVFGSINPEDIVEYMKSHNMNGINLQLQLHKYIWDPMKQGV